MDARDKEDVIVSLTERLRGFRVLKVGPYQNKRLHTLLPRLADHLVRIRIVFRRMNVTVGVNQHGARLPSECSAQRSRKLGGFDF